MSVRHSQNTADVVAVDIDLSGVAARIYVNDETGRFVTAGRLYVPYRVLRSWLRQVKVEQEHELQGTLPL